MNSTSKARGRIRRIQRGWSRGWSRWKRPHFQRGFHVDDPQCIHVEMSHPRCNHIASTLQIHIASTFPILELLLTMHWFKNQNIFLLSYCTSYTSLAYIGLPLVWYSWYFVNESDTPSFCAGGGIRSTIFWFCSLMCYPLDHGALVWAS